MTQTGEQLVRVGQDTRLNYRVLDLRTPANQAIFRIQCHVEDVSSQYYIPDLALFFPIESSFLCSLFQK